jgi:iron(II)-dependent oxidoreductase
MPTTMDRSCPPDAAGTADLLAAVRERTLGLVAHVDDADLERPLDPVMSPLVWDLGHIAAYEDLWLVHRHGGRALLHPELAAAYDAFETPRRVRAELELPGRDEAVGYLRDVRERTLEVLDERGPDRVLHEMVARHELQHTETMLQSMALGGVLPPGVDGPAPGTPGADHEWVVVPAGATTIGAAGGGFAYDNERPRHRVHLRAFAVARAPVSNASWLSFAEGGGYERREWWSDEGWAWKQEYDITGHAGAAAGPGTAAVCRVSWFEADAFARSRSARLPTEAEWERAATWEHDPPGDRGRVWEWTASAFSGYPGFRAHPYREYSEVFFDGRHRVLRGGSFATHPRVATPTVRNWDLPARRQLFAGVRLAHDA